MDYSKWGSLKHGYAFLTKCSRIPWDYMGFFGNPKINLWRWVNKYFTTLYNADVKVTSHPKGPRSRVLESGVTGFHGINFISVTQLFGFLLAGTSSCWRFNSVRLVLRPRPGLVL